MLARLHGRLAAASYFAIVTGAAVAIGFALDLGAAAFSVPSLHGAAGGEAYAWWNVASLVVIGALFARSLVRYGPRAWFGAALRPG